MARKKYIMGILLILSVFIFACANQEEQMEQENQGITELDLVNDNDADTNNDADVKTFYVEGGPMFEFFIDGERNADIVVNVGDRVRIVYESVGGMPHDFVIDEIEGARTEIWSPGDGETIEFVANVAGEFEYYCSVGSHRANGMVGRFIVQE